METHLSLDDLNHSLLSIFEVDPKANTSHIDPDRSTGVFLAVMAQEESKIGPSKPKSMPQYKVEDLTNMYRNQGKMLFQMLQSVEYQNARFIPTRFDENDPKGQYIVLKTRMAEIYSSKDPNALAVMKLDPKLEFEQIEALEYAFLKKFDEYGGRLELSCNGEQLNPKILKVIHVAAKDYVSKGSDQRAIIKFLYYQTTPAVEEILDSFTAEEGILFL